MTIVPAHASRARTVAPYGSWKSPITAESLVANAVGLEQITLDGDVTYWIELRPSEGGRSVIVRRDAQGKTADITPQPFNARTRVHEYGGRSYAVHGDTIYFANFADQRICRVTPGTEPEPITPEGAMRYGDFVVDEQRKRLLCVREDHGASDREAVNTLASLRLDGSDDDGGTVLASGNDFYSTPRLSADGARLCWLSWNHPNMPWDGCELWVAEVDANGALGKGRRIAGGLEESIFQPTWGPDGALYFASDRTGWWNLYRWRGGRVANILRRKADCGAPQWALGMTTYAVISATRLLCAWTSRGVWRLGELDTKTHKLTPLDLPYSAITGVQANATRAVFIAGSPIREPAVVELNLKTKRTRTLRESRKTALDPAYISIPRAIEFPTEDGLTAHGFYYPPRNPGYRAPAGEKLPLLVMSHGGPTSAVNNTLNPRHQYWTSRGFAVLDVNYGGSSGYGRAYRQRLAGRWGIVDVDDCVNGARYLAARGLADPQRLAIRGGSAGGYTTLAALAFRDAFAAGASLFGVSDLEALARETHKFESRYLDGLIGPYPARKDLYRERSPIHYVNRIAAPMILFQGLEDRVVPPSQAELMVAALKKKALPVAYVAFEGEGHGFRRAETIIRAHEAELYFYSRIFGFTLPEPIGPVEIVNAPEERMKEPAAALRRKDTGGNRYA
jgi:dipeptidyl aminopeptidase/acylaminoacyl peptidase